jgi:nucleotide-binding universal stress UspA family protein
MTALVRILVAAELSAGSLQAVHRAGMLARELAAGLSVVRVVDPDVEDLDLVQARTELEAAVSGVDLPPESDLDVVTGAPFVEIIRKARSIEAGLIVVGFRGPDAGPRSGLGTTAERVVRKGDRPVLSVRRRPAATYRRVMVGVDYSEHAGAALDLASTLAPRAAVQIIHAYPLLGVRKLEAAGASPGEVAAYLRTIEEREAKRLGAYVRERGLHGVSHHVIPGPAQTGLPALARDRRADLLVVGSHGSTALRHVLLGSVAEHALRDAGCDVLVVRRGAVAFELP